MSWLQDGRQHQPDLKARIEWQGSLVLRPRSQALPWQLPLSQVTLHLCMPLLISYAVGAAALITQYLADETFWATICQPSLSLSCRQGAFKPSGYLLKALLIHSGTPINTSQSIF
jgi:hypothetical protein